MSTALGKLFDKITCGYVCGTMSYGLIRATTYDYKGSMSYYSRSKNSMQHREKLLVEKVCDIMGGTFSAMILWPVFMGSDLARLECAVRGQDPVEYGVVSKD